MQLHFLMPQFPSTQTRCIWAKASTLQFSDYQFQCLANFLGSHEPWDSHFQEQRQGNICSVQSCSTAVPGVSGEVLRKEEVTPGPHRGRAISKVHSWRGQNNSIRSPCQPLGKREQHSAPQEWSLQCGLPGVEPL